MTGVTDHEHEADDFDRTICECCCGGWMHTSCRCGFVFDCDCHNQ